jgi:CMP-N-acetylneuraminic acid synthetase
MTQESKCYDITKVTVYIPTHNYGKFLSQAINSVIKQKFNDWELIVIDDGSTDDTRDILKGFSAHPKIKIIHQERKGLAVTNNIALRLSQGEYIMRLDADDYLDENALLVLSNILNTHPEIGLVYPDYYRVDEDGEIIDIERRKKIGQEVELLDLPAHGACTMMRKSCLLELGGYDESLSCQDGYELWLRFIERFKPYNVNVPLFYYRQHGRSLTQDKKKVLLTRHRAKRNFVKRKFGRNMPRVLAIIPVRKQSNIYPDLALRELAGKPLIYYTISQALETDLLDKVVVTSDDEEILGYVRSFPRILTLRRPAELCLPNSRIEPTVEYVLSYLKKNMEYCPDAVMLLYIHTPLRKRVHIEKAIDTMLIFNVDSVISVCEDLNFYYQHTKQGLAPLVKRRLLRLERDALYRENGAIYLSRTSAIKRDSFLGNSISHIAMLPEESIKIDSEFNFWLAEKVIGEWDDSKKQY